jgi:hypothetical protein
MEAAQSVADSSVDYQTRVLTYPTLTVMDDVLCAGLDKDMQI